MKTILNLEELLEIIDQRQTSTDYFVPSLSFFELGELNMMDIYSKMRRTYDKVNFAYEMKYLPGGYALLDVKINYGLMIGHLLLDEITKMIYIDMKSFGITSSGQLGFDNEIVELPKIGTKRLVKHHDANHYLFYTVIDRIDENITKILDYSQLN
ncbi:MAG: hypothetical protein PHI41_11040 [Erysipelotrichaceae bacterium]|nr:hypothetical protein [Erysipelotrichaceae bacterium]MDD3809589.1 hypothetical protein [Erysipelotrichaceae bacterium]